LEHSPLNRPVLIGKLEDMILKMNQDYEENKSKKFAKKDVNRLENEGTIKN
jgi:hypothetical protein